MSIPYVVDGETDLDSLLFNPIIDGANAGIATARNALVAGYGLSDPNISIQRLNPIPTAMASPPTVTPGSSGGSTAIANSILYGPSGTTTDVFSFFGCPATLGTVTPNDVMYSPQNTVSAGTVNNVGNFAVEFEWYGAEFELFVKGTGAHYLLMVDGQYDNRDGRDDTATDGAGWLINYDFGSTAFRRIRFEFEATVYFGGIRIGPNDSIWKSSAPRGPKVIVTGDSFTETFTTWPQMMGWLLGWRDIAIVGKGSTGYLDISAGGDTFRDRAQKDIYDQNPDIVIVSGGLNDNNRSYASILAEANTFFAEIRAELPDAILIVSGVQYVFGAADSGIVPVRDAVRTAAATYADAYIEQIGGPYPYSGVDANYTDAGWMTGLGKVGATTGTGNSDIFRSADNTHPTQAGQDYRGFRHAQAIAAAMPIGGL